MTDRCNWPQLTGIANQKVQAAPALGHSSAQTVERITICHIHRNAGCLSAIGANVVIKGFERALRAADQQNMGTRQCQSAGDGVSEPSRCTCDKRHTPAEIRFGSRHRIDYACSASSDSCLTWPSSCWSVKPVG